MLKLGSHGPMVSAWTELMKSRYRSYANGRDGYPLKNDGYFGYDEQEVQSEWQFRTGQRVTGEVSDHDLWRLGLKPTLLSIHGTGQADPFGIGYPADIARRLPHLYHWQPVGNYPALAIGMGDSVEQGQNEVNRLFRDVIPHHGPVAFVDYSQGSIIGGQTRNMIREGVLQHELVASASFGNPMRHALSYVGNVDPGGTGIAPVLELAAEPQCVDLAAPGDLYTTCEQDDEGEMKRAVYNAVMGRWTGKDSIGEQLLELLNPTEWWALVKAVWDGGLFVLRGTGPHVRYHLDFVPGQTITYYEFAVSHLAQKAEERLIRIGTPKE